MIAEQPTRKVTKELRAAGFTRVRDAKGSHGFLGVPDGPAHHDHPRRTQSISPGVIRKVNKALAECDCK